MQSHCNGTLISQAIQVACVLLNAVSVVRKSRVLTVEHRAREGGGDG